MIKIYSFLAVTAALMITSFSTQTASAQLSGIYTIDPSQPTAGNNFKYFGDALTVLNTIGVNDTTVFNIASGVYDTLLTFSSAIPGMGATAPITFQSATGNAADVILKHKATSATDNYVVDFNGVKFVSFKNITFRAIGTYFTTCITLRNNCKNILIEGSSLIGPATTLTSADLALLHTLDYSKDTNIVIRNNVFINGAIGIDMYGNSAPGKNNVIDGNTFSNFYKSAIVTKDQNSILICNNDISTNSGFGNTAAVELLTSDYARVLKNRIVSPRFKAILLNSCNGDTLLRGEISNNFISVGQSTAASSALNLQGSTYYNVFHNSVLCANTNTSSVAFGLSGATNVIVKNNIFSNSGGGFAFYANATSTFVSDYNNLYTTGSYIGWYPYTNCITLADWVQASGKDSNSVSVGPGFISSSDLHTYNFLTQDMGTPVGITDDIDGEIRSTTAPDIGADEYSIISDDAGVVAVVEPANSPGPVINVNNGFKIQIKNFGTDTLTKAVIGWKLNGVLQPQFVWLDTLLPGMISGNILVDSVMFSIPGKNSIGVWTMQPNDVPDANGGNDTLKKQFLVCPGGLDGNYSIDPSQPTTGTNFQSFSDVLIGLNSCGIADTTIFNIASGIYDTLLTFQNTITGINPFNPLIFQSATGNPADVVLRNIPTSYANNYVIDLNGAKYITFRNLTFQSLGTLYSTCILLRNSSRDIKIENNVFEGLTVTAWDSSRALIRSLKATNENYITISNNSFINASFGIYLEGMSTTFPESNNKILDNTFTNFYASAVYTQNESYMKISNNVLSTNTQYSGGSGLSLSYTDYSKITNNRISVPKSYGIHLYYCDGMFSNYGEVSNNFVLINGSSIYPCIGIGSLYSTMYNFYHNSVLVTGTFPTDSRAFQVSNGTSCNVKNNIVANFSGGYAIYTDTSSYKSDFNNLYTTGTYLGLYGNTSVKAIDLPDWITKSHRDSNSVSMNPEFISLTDLHTYCIPMDNLGTPLSITTDIDGEPRSTVHPDLGADEYTLYNENAGVVEISEPLSVPYPIKDTIYSAKVRIKNFGIDTLNKVTINWSVNNVLQTPFLWTGLVLPGEISDSIAIGNMFFPSPGTATIKAWTSLPNDSADEYVANDSLSKTYTICSLVFAGNYTIDPGLPTGGNNYQYFDEVIDILNECGVHDTTVFNIANGIYDTLLTFPKTIPGMSSTAPITFQSASGNPTDVVLQQNSISDIKNYIIEINGAHHLSFRNMTLRALGSNYGNCFRIGNNAGFIEIEGNILEGQATNSTSAEMALIRDLSGTNDSCLIIRNNVFNRGSCGIYSEGIGSTSLTNTITVENNQFIDYNYSGIYLSCFKNAVLSGNNLKTNSAFPSSVSVSLNYCDNSIVSKNKINQPFNKGLYFNYCDGTASARSEISNNFISVGGSVYAIGLHLNYSNYQNVFHNSIHCWGNNNTSITIRFDNSSDFELKNNILSNTADGKVIFINGITSGTSDYNNLYTTGQTIGAIEYFTFSNFTEWSTQTGMDNNSVNENPYFTSTEDLHISTFTLNGVGTPVGVTTDIDNEARSLTNPDIGADEFIPFPYNTGVVSILSPQDTSYLMQDSVYNAKVQIKNFGPDTLVKAEIEWSVNGIMQPSVIWTGTLLPDEVSVDILLNTVSFSNVGNNTIKAWTKLPNDHADSFIFNDSLSIVYYVCRTIFGGVYTLDPSQASAGNNYKYFSDIVTGLSTCGVSDTTVFNIAPGVYDTLLHFTSPIPGMGPNAPIILQSATGNASDVTILHDAADVSENYVVYLEGVNHIALKNLTIQALDTSFSNCVRIGGGATNILIEGNIIQSQVSSMLYWERSAIINDFSGADSNIVIRNNQILNGALGIYMRGPTPGNENNNVIEGNIISGYLCFGINANHQNNLTINNNTISTNSTSTLNFGVYFNTCNFSTISKNHISQQNGYGISLNSCTGSSMSHGNVINNFVFIGDSANAFGISLAGTDYYNIYHNTVHCMSSNISSSRSYYSTSSYYNEIKNNVFANSGGGYAIHCTTNNSISDFNVLYTNGDTLCYYGSTPCITLSDWNATAMKDSNSVNANPGFVSPTDLHVTGYASNNSGTPLLVTDDIDGELRDLVTPDIGADEFTPLISPVYPGDISNDGLVDGNDLLLLGLNYNVPGSPRDSVSIDWLPQTSFDWGANMSGAALDLKFADCNGDGITLYNDTMAISQNYGLTHTFKTGITPNFPKATPTVSLLFPDTITVNTPTQIEVVLSDAANPFTDLHGIKFDFNVNTNVHIANFTLTALLAAPATQLKLLKNTGTNEYSLAFTKTDGTGFSGYGSAATITMMFDSIAGLPFNTTATVSNAVSLNSDGTWNSPTGSASSFILASGTTVQINEMESNLDLNIHPNPASTQTEISFTLPAPGKCVLTLRNTLGELIQTTTIDGQSGKNSVNVDLSNLGQGIFVYTLEYKDVVLTRRLSVMR